MDKPEENNARIEPIRLGPKSQFEFECHKGVSCFTRCCRGIDIMLTPYDVLRMKKKLDLPSDEFLAIYTEIKLLEKTDMPVATLKLLDDEQKSCPFVRDEGCLIYDDRPTTCRYYPLGVATLSNKEGADGDEFYIMVNEPHCKGFEEKKEWTGANWRKDQGVDIHDEINAGWTDILVRKRSYPADAKLSEKSKQMFFMVSYNIDSFKRFVFESDFLNMYSIDDELIEKIKEDDVALLDFGFSWLKSMFFADDKSADMFKKNEDAIAERVAKKSS